MFKKRLGLAITGMIAACLFLNSPLFAKGLKVSPSSYHWKGVELGEESRMPVSITIINDSDHTRYYHLRTRVPAEIGASVEKNTDVLPDAEWVSFDNVMVEVPARGSKEVHLFIKIPREAGNFNKVWMFYVEVKEEISRYGYLRGKPDIFALACYPKVYVMTKKK